VYWSTQFGGWFTYVGLSGLLNKLDNVPFNRTLIINLVVVFVTGVSVSHLYRTLINKWEWKTLDFGSLIPRVIFSAIGFSLLFHAIFLLAIGGLTEEPYLLEITFNVRNFLSWLLIFLVWSLIYFSFHFFSNYRKEEIKNLKWEASWKEIELNKIKSQINPHFMFNAMNSIRALVDEDPRKAKQSITQLSNILRGSLKMGSLRSVPFTDELNLVQDYLAIETARFEERLTTEFSIDPESKMFEVPPLMLQTLVENGIKHGISKLPEGGKITLKTRVENAGLLVEIRNPGQYDPRPKKEGGYGLKNTKQQLELLYGEAGWIKIDNPDNMVITKVFLPITKP